MATSKKFGTFGGVFTPSLLTILGVIMYMRLGWVVGNAGLIGALIIIAIAHVISITTGLSISSIATDKKIGAGGVYYVLSRSLGLPIGGSIGLTLFAGTALSIALYLVGFAESLNSYLGLDPSINGIRITGTIALLSLAAIALISTAVALKTQYFILAAIVISLVAIFFGHSDSVPSVVPMFGGEGSASMETVFAIFFPAVTGFTAGIAMSGDLRDSKKSIPQGTIAAIAVGFVVYVGLAIFIAYQVSPDVLVADNNIMMKISLAAPAVVAGIWGATLSSALGGILGGPRILQAMSVDRITPRFFGKGRGKANEPWNALFLTVIIAEAGILIGELDMIARVVSMFYLAAYGVINISFFLESWASADFKPSFRVKRWVGLVGFIATFAVMFKLDLLAMIAAFVVIGGVYAWLQRKQLALGTGDIWQSVWSSVVKTGLRKMAATEDHRRNWKPNVLLFSGASDDRSHMLEFSKSLAGRSGVITNFDLIEDPEAQQLFPKHKQAVSDEVLDRFGIFGRRIHVQNVFKGIEGIAGTFGFSGIEPNTVLMGWPKNTKDPIWFAQMTQKLIDLDYNVLYLDYDERRGFGKQETIDLWWRSIGQNAELMLNLARFISSSQDWNNASIRVFLVNEQHQENKLLRIRIANLLGSLRVDAEVHVINNATEQVPFYDLVKLHSGSADLIFTGIPELAPENVSTFAADTTELVGVIGTTLLVRSSSKFESASEAQGGDIATTIANIASMELEPLALPSDPVVAQALTSIDQRAEHAAAQLKSNALDPLSGARQHLIDRRIAILREAHVKLNKASVQRAFDVFSPALKEINSNARKIQHDEGLALDELMGRSITQYLLEREQLFLEEPLVIRTADAAGRKGQRIAWRKNLTIRSITIGANGVRDALNALGLQELRLAHRMSMDTSLHVQKVSKALLFVDREERVAALSALAGELDEMHKAHLAIAVSIPEYVLHAIRTSDRTLCNSMAEGVTKGTLREQRRALTTGAYKKEARSVGVYNAGYAQSWSRNNRLFHQQVAISNDLVRFLLRFDDVSRNSLARLRSEHLHGMRMHIKRIGGALESAELKLTSEDGDTISTEAFHMEDDLFFNPDQLTEELSARYGEIMSDVPDEAELISAASLNGFAEDQGDSIHTEELALNKITDHLVQTHFVDPLQEKLLKLGRQFDRVSVQVKGVVDIMQIAIAQFAEGKDKDRMQTAISLGHKELLEASKILDLAWRAFTSELTENRDSLAEAIEIRSLIEQAIPLSANIKLAHGRRGLKHVLARAAGVIGRRIGNFGRVLEARDRRVALARFDRANQGLRNLQGSISDMMVDLTLDAAVADHVPFHYQFLFSGKQLNVTRNLENRVREKVEAEKAIRRIHSGASGGIMIVGGSLSGKTFFSEHVARTMCKGEIIRINAPALGATTRQALTIAFQEALGSDSLMDRMLSDRASNTTFILNDLEKWWSLEEDGSEAIDHLATMIDRHGGRHVFLLNANMHAFGLMKETVSLPLSLISTILLAPLSIRELTQELWVRHRSGGMDLTIAGRQVDSINDKAFRSLGRRIHAGSKGNIGMALRIWLAGVTHADETSIAVEAPGVVQFPEMEDAAWKSMLYQFTLYREMGRARIHELYRHEGEKWVDRHIASMQRSGILDETSRQVYSLAPASRPVVETWLQEIRILD